MNARSNIKGFFSYARQNDKNSGGNLTSLRKYLEAELWEQTGENIEIFQDQEDISWGELWEKKIATSLNSSKFFIAIVTPSYLKSNACRFELEQFLKLEKTIGSERILPLIYIDTPELKDTKDLFFSEINKRQWFDWKSLRFAKFTSTRAKKQLEVFARRIRELIEKEIIPTNINKTNFNFPNSVIRPTIPEDWDNEWQPSFDQVVIASKPESKLKNNEEGQSPLQQITLLLRPTGDSDRDKRRIKTLYGTLISFHGKDKFSFQVFENGNGHVIDFPNDTTNISPELLARLKRLKGDDDWKIEPISLE